MPALQAFGQAESLRWCGILLDAAAKGLLVLAAAGAVSLLLRRSSAAVRHMVWSLAAVSLLGIPVFSLAFPGWRAPILPDWTRSAAEPVQAQRIEMERPAPPAEVLMPVDVAKSADVDPAPAMPLPGSRSETRVEHSPPAPDAPGVAAPAAAELPPPAGPHWSGWVLLVWTAGALVMAGPLLVGTLAVCWRVRRSVRLTDQGWPALLEGLRLRLGVRRPVALRRSPGSDIPCTCGLWRPVILLPADSAA